MHFRTKFPGPWWAYVAVVIVIFALTASCTPEGYDPSGSTVYTGQVTELADINYGELIRVVDREYNRVCWIATYNDVDMDCIPLE